MQSIKRLKMENCNTILISVMHRKIEKSHTKIMNLKCLLQNGMVNLKYQMDHILYQIFRITLSILSRSTEH